MSIEAQRKELEGLGFRIVEETPDSVVGVVKRFHWECVFTAVTYVVFVRQVAELTAALIESDRAELQSRATRLDASALPRGLQKGTAVITAYLADHVTAEARALCETKPKMRFAFFYVPAVLDRSSGVSHFLRSTPAWGALYFSKFRFVIERVLRPGAGGASWPLSIGGAILTLLVLASFGISLMRIFSR